MHGLITQLTTTAEQRDELVRLLAAGSTGMPGCLGYVVALDTARDDAVWITELWTDAHAHAASLALPQVQDAVAKGRPLITGIAQRITTNPVAGL